MTVGSAEGIGAGDALGSPLCDGEPLGGVEGVALGVTEGDGVGSGVPVGPGLGAESLV